MRRSKRRNQEESEVGDEKVGAPSKHQKHDDDSPESSDSGDDAKVVQHGSYTVDDSDEEDALDAPPAAVQHVASEEKKVGDQLEAARKAVASTADQSLSAARTALALSSKDAAAHNAVASAASCNPQKQFASVSEHISQFDVSNLVCTPDTWEKPKKGGGTETQHTFNLGDRSRMEHWMNTVPRPTILLPIAQQSWAHGFPVGNFKGITGLEHGAETLLEATQDYRLNMYSGVWGVHYANRTDPHAPELSLAESKEIEALSKDDPWMTKAWEKLDEIDDFIFNHVTTDATLWPILRKVCAKELKEQMAKDARRKKEKFDPKQKLLDSVVKDYARSNKWNSPFRFATEEDPDNPGEKITNFDKRVLVLKKKLFKKRYKHKKKGVDESNIPAVMADFGIQHYAALQAVCEPTNDAPHGRHYNTIRIMDGSFNALKHSEGPRIGDMVAFTAQVVPYFYENGLCGWTLSPVRVNILSRGPPMTGAYDPDAAMRTILGDVKIAGSQSLEKQRLMLQEEKERKVPMIQAASSQALIVRDQNPEALAQHVMEAAKVDKIAGAAALFGSAEALTKVEASVKTHA